MINYLSSEKYRLLRMKSLYFGYGLYFLVPIFTAIFLKSTNEKFLSTNYTFYLSFFLINIFFSILLLVLTNLFSISREYGVIKNSICLGIPRDTIFLGKLTINLLLFSGTFVINSIFSIMIGETIFKSVPQSLSNYQLSTINILPIMVSAFVFAYVLSILGIGQITTTILLLFFYTLFGETLHLLLYPILKHEKISELTLSNLLAKTGNNFYLREVNLMIENWLIGTMTIVAILIVGLRVFRKKEMQ